MEEVSEYSEVSFFIDPFGQFNDAFGFLCLCGEEDHIGVSFDDFP